VRLPGFEPGLKAWEASVLTTRLQPLQDHFTVSSWLIMFQISVLP
jgi:hypothetical protein